MQIDAAAQYYRQLAQDLIDQGAIMSSKCAELQREVDQLRAQLNEEKPHADS